MVSQVENLQRLRVLRAVALEGSFTRAAHALAMSQPAVSQHITALERELGARLVDRAPTGATLTPEGAVTLRHALRVLQTVEETRREIDRLRSGEHDPVRIAAFPTACAHLVPRATAELRRRAPSASFAFTESDADDALRQVRHGETDVAVVYDYAAHPLDLGGLTVHHLVDDPVGLVVPLDHPASQSVVVDIADLADEPWIRGTAYGCVESLHTVCGAAGFAPKVALDSSRYPTTLAMVAAGHGVALVPASALRTPPPGVVSRTLRPSPPPRRIWAATHPDTSADVSLMVDCLVATSRAEG
jgi:molybdate transport repressor ModE-like protein